MNANSGITAAGRRPSSKPANTSKPMEPMDDNERVSSSLVMEFGAISFKACRECCKCSSRTSAKEPTRLSASDQWGDRTLDFFGTVHRLAE